VRVGISLQSARRAGLPMAKLTLLKARRTSMPLPCPANGGGGQRFLFSPVFFLGAVLVHSLHEDSLDIHELLDPIV